MLLTDMEQAVLTKIGLPGASNPTTATLDRELNRAWQRTIVNMVPASGLRGPLFFNLVQGTDTYDLDKIALYATSAAAVNQFPILPGIAQPVRSVRRSIQVGPRKQYYYANPERFWDEYVITDLTQSDPPQSCLVQAKILVFRPIPGLVSGQPAGGVGPVAVECVQYRQILTSAGVGDDEEAIAVVYAAAAAVAYELGYDKIGQKHDGLFKEQLGYLSNKYETDDEGDGMVEVLPGF